MNTGYLICIQYIHIQEYPSLKVKYTELYNSFQRELFSKTLSCLHSNTMLYNTRLKLSHKEKRKQNKCFAQAQTGHKVHKRSFRSHRIRGSRGDTLLQMYSACNPTIRGVGGVGVHLF